MAKRQAASNRKGGATVSLYVPQLKNNNIKYYLFKEGSEQENVYNI